jgi:hypothetical protein
MYLGILGMFESHELLSIAEQLLKQVLKHVPKSQLALETFLIPISYLSPKQLPKCFESHT